MFIGKLVVDLYMTTQEVIQELRQKSKPYVGVMPQQTFSHTIKMIEAGLAKDSTTVKFLAKFGYTVEKERTWKKTQ